MNKRSAEKQRRKDLTRQVVSNRESGNAPLAGWFSQHLSRRSFGKGIAWTAALGAAGLTVYQIAGSGDKEVTLDSLDLQRKSGWNVGSTDKTLAFDGSV